MSIKSFAFPNLKEKDRSKLIEQLKREAYDWKSDKKAQPLSNKQLAEILKGRAR